MKEGNIFSDPLFIDSGNGNYHLQSNSPCIDTGINLSKNSNSLPLMYIGDIYYKDKDGMIRIQDGNDDGIAICDMGAYEFSIQSDQDQPIVISPIEEDQDQPIETDQNQPIQISQDKDKSSSSSGGCFIKTLDLIMIKLFDL